jgi:hypothetical protein
MIAAKRPEQCRLGGNPSDFTHFRPGQSIAAYLGNCWSPAEVQKVYPDHLLVAGRRLGSRARVTFSVHDARNASNSAELLAAAKEQARRRKQEIAAELEQEELEADQ